MSFSVARFRSQLQTLKRQLSEQCIARMLAKPDRRRARSIEDGPVVVAGLFNAGSGIGESARACYRALNEAGIECHAYDLSDYFEQTDFKSEIPMIDRLPEGPGTLIIHMNGPELLRSLWKMRFLRGRNWRVIGYWAWELTKPPKEWASAQRYLSEVWVPSLFVANTLRPILDIPVSVVPHYVPVQPPKPVIVEDGLTFMAMADGLSSFERKNLKGSVSAYVKAFPDAGPNKLVIKCRNLDQQKEVGQYLRDLAERREDITLITECLDSSATKQLIREANVMISLHRTEGFGLTLAESMSAGNLVVATGWSGNLEFMSDENSLLVPYTLIPVRDTQKVYPEDLDTNWADADEDAAVSILRSIAADPASYKRRRERARQEVAENLSYKPYLKALGVDTNDLEPSEIQAAE